MIKYIQTPGNVTIAELTDKSFVLNRADEVPEILSELGMNDCGILIIHEENLNKDFFRLATGLAGDILQKFSNYRFRLAIVGDFSKYTSKNLNDFIRESNRGNLVFFANDKESAYSKFSGKKQ
jgi:hypothetical protein